MTSRERVLCAFAHQQPDRVPLWYGMSGEFQAGACAQLGIDEEALRVRLGDDFRRVFTRYVGPQYRLLPGAHTRTVFGVHHAGVGWGQPLHHPLADATSSTQIEDYPWPDPDWFDVSRVRADALAWDRKYAILAGEWSPLWHDAIDLFGMENLYMKMYDDPDLVDLALTKITNFYADLTQRTFNAAADAIDIFFIGNDLGSQTGPLLGEDLFRRFLLPHLKRLFDLGHDYGLKVQMHCCGGYVPLIPSLIEAGLDAVHAVQTTCRGMDLAVLKREFGQKLVFNGGIDSHHVLIDGTPDFVSQRTREVLKIMMPGGGYIAGASHDSILPETPLQNVLAMADAVFEHGVYR